jgi:hypothetical protein
MADNPTGAFLWECLQGRVVKSASSMATDLSGFGNHMAMIEFEDGSTLTFTVMPEAPVRLFGGPAERGGRVFIPAKGPK